MSDTPPVDSLFLPANARDDMSPSDEPNEEQIRAIVREEVTRTARELVGTVLWTLLSVFTVLVGVQLFQFALYAASAAAAAGFVLAGAAVTGSSLYLLYLTHWA